LPPTSTNYAWPALERLIMTNAAGLYLQSGAGLLVFAVIAWLFSTNRKATRWRLAVTGIAIQVLVAFALTRLPGIRRGFDVLNDAIVALQGATESGASFVFGFLGGGVQPFTADPPGSDYVLAFRALPLILVLSALTSLLTYWRILPFIVRGFAFILEKTFGIGGAVGLGASANVFLGMVEAPLFVRPYLARLSSSELFVLMCTGMATIAGTVLVLYAAFLSPVIDDAIGHLLVASIISVPAAITMAHLLVPETEAITEGDYEPANHSTNAIAAIAEGTQEGLNLCLQIAAMLIVLIALVSLTNMICVALLPDMGGEPVTIERMLGFLMAPLAWLTGIPWREAIPAGQFLGVKLVLNEFVAYREFADAATEFSPRSRLIMLYAMSGFANIGSLGIMIGGLGAMVPERRTEIIRLGPIAVLGGLLATLSTGAVIGLVELSR